MCHPQLLNNSLGYSIYLNMWAQCRKQKTYCLVTIIFQSPVHSILEDYNLLKSSLSVTLNHLSSFLRFHPPTVVALWATQPPQLNFCVCLHLRLWQLLRLHVHLLVHHWRMLLFRQSHLGNAAQRGLEAAQLALLGLESNKQILDLESGFNLKSSTRIIFHFHYQADVSQISSYRWMLEEQDVAFK